MTKCSLTKVYYIEYLYKLKEHILIRFHRGTYNSCEMMGKLLNFNWMIFPCSSGRHITDVESMNVQEFKEILEGIPFSLKTEDDF